MQRAAAGGRRCSRHLWLIRCGLRERPGKRKREDGGWALGSSRLGPGTANYVLLPLFPNSLTSALYRARQRMDPRWKRLRFQHHFTNTCDGMVGWPWWLRFKMKLKGSTLYCPKEICEINLSHSFSDSRVHLVTSQKWGRFG